MKLFIIFTQPNPNFDKQYAKEYHFGKESNNNLKNNWSIGYKISESIKELLVIENGEFHLTGTKANENFDFIIPNMKILHCLTKENELFNVAVSNSLILRTQCPYNKKYDTTRFYFYFNFIEYINPTETIFITKNDFPKELLS